MTKKTLKSRKTLSEFFKNRSIVIFQNKKASKKFMTKANSNFNKKKIEIEL